jgi:16S rRNA (guanine1207-N2)-methyltransferase
MSVINQEFIREIKQTSGPILWVLDEHQTDLNARMLGEEKDITFITNRVDQHELLEAAGLKSLYSDFDFSQFPNHHFDLVLYRISKEKAVVHHVINQAANVLKSDATLLLAGGKNEGIKTYSDKAAKYLGCGKSIEKLTKDIWLSSLTNQHTDQTPLDDKSYRAFQTIGEENGRTFISKPGVFGWNKIDQGSALLLEQMPEFIKRLNISKEDTTSRVLDLGCGYGYLLSAMKDYSFETLVGTDNNAAAIQAAEATMKANDIDAQIIPANCAESINQKFDVIVCNPPFHQGFSVENEMTDRFLAATRRLLTSGGAAIFVVNTFIPLEAKAKNYFKKVDLLANNKSFKVLRLTGKKPFHRD